MVVHVDKHVSKPFKVGDRVMGVVHDCNLARPGDGAFAEYIVVKGDMQIHIPDRLSFEEAASVGVGILTAGMGLYHVSRTAITRSNEVYNIVRQWCC